MRDGPLVRAGIGPSRTRHPIQLETCFGGVSASRQSFPCRMLLQPLHLLTECSLPRELSRCQYAKDCYDFLTSRCQPGYPDSSTARNDPRLPPFSQPLGLSRNTFAHDYSLCYCLECRRRRLSGGFRTSRRGGSAFCVPVGWVEFAIPLEAAELGRGVMRGWHVAFCGLVGVSRSSSAGRRVEVAESKDGDDVVLSTSLHHEDTGVAPLLREMLSKGRGKEPVYFGESLRVRSRKRVRRPSNRPASEEAGGPAKPVEDNVEEQIRVFVGEADGFWGEKRGLRRKKALAKSSAVEEEEGEVEEKPASSPMVDSVVEEDGEIADLPLGDDDPKSEEPSSVPEDDEEEEEEDEEEEEEEGEVRILMDGGLNLDEYRMDGSDKSPYIVFSPSVRYCSLPRFCVRTSYAGETYLVALRVRVHPGAYHVRPESILRKHEKSFVQLDPFIANDVIEWRTNRRKVSVVTAILVKKIGRRPLHKLPSVLLPPQAGELETYDDDEVIMEPPPDLRPTSPLPSSTSDKLEWCIRHNFCTYHVTAKEHARQRWWHCSTCRLTGNLGCCAVCRETCHAGHSFVFLPSSDSSRTYEHSDSPSRFYCDCGASKPRCQHRHKTIGAVGSDGLLVPPSEPPRRRRRRRRRRANSLGHRSQAARGISSRPGDLFAEIRRGNFALNPVRRINERPRAHEAPVTRGESLMEALVRRARERREEQTRREEEERRRQQVQAAPVTTPSERLSLCVRQGCCTFKLTGRTYQRQRWWQCRQCNLTGGRGCCEVCRDACHAGHNTFEAANSPSEFYCDCGADRSSCRKRNQEFRADGTRTGMVMFDFEASDGEELSVQEGQSVTLVNDQGEWYLVRNSDGVEGYVPASYIELQ